MHIINSIQKPTIALLLSLIALPVSFWGNAYENPLYIQRANHDSQSLSNEIAGNVINVTKNKLSTTINGLLLREEGIESQHQIQINLAGKRLTALVLDTKDYRDLRLSRQWQETLSVDVLCIVNKANVEVIALSGPLFDWLDVERGTQLSFSRYGQSNAANSQANQ